MVANLENQKFGPIWLAPGISRTNLLTKFYASFVCIAMLSAITFLQPYILAEHLQIAQAEQGAVAGNLQFWNQLVAIFLLSPFGMLSDRVGRRPVLIFGILVAGMGLAMTPFATSLTELTAIRVIYAVGSAAASTTMVTITNDYPQERSRGKMVGINSIMTNMGLAFVALGLAQMPAMLTDAGFDPLAAGRMAFLAAAILCIVSAVVFRLGLKGGTPVAPAEQPGLKTLLASGFRAAANPRIALSYATSFVGRSNNVIRGVYLPLWAVHAGQQVGMDAGAAMARIGVIFFGMILVGMCWAPIFGWLMDRLNRITALCIALAFAVGGYCSMAVIESPLENGALPFLFLLTLGSATPLMAGVVLLGQEAPAGQRGSIFGMSGLIGAIGIALFSWAGGQIFDAVAPWAPFVMMGAAQAILLAAAVTVRVQSPGPSRN